MTSRSNFSSLFNNQSLTTNRTRNVFFEQHFSSFIIYLVIASLLCLFTIFSNLICLFAIITYPSLRRRANALIANLIVCSLILSITVYPLTIVQIIYRQYNEMPAKFCNWMVYFYFCQHAFIWQECLLAFNRFISIIKPKRHKKLSSRSAVGWTIFSGYFIALTLNLVTFYVKSDIYRSNPPFGGCQYDQTTTSVLPVIHAVLGSYAPMCLIGACYFLAFAVICLRKFRPSPQVTMEQRVVMLNQHLQKKRLRLTYMLFGSFLWNVLMSLPQPLLTAFYKDSYVVYPWTFFFVRVLITCSVAGNAIIYGFLNKDYRDGMLAVLRGKTRFQISPRRAVTETA